MGFLNVSIIRTITYYILKISRNFVHEYAPPPQPYLPHPLYAIQLLWWGEFCSGSFLLHARMSFVEILHAIYSSDSIRYPFPDHTWSRRGCEFPEGLLYAGIVFYRNHQ